MNHQQLEATFRIKGWAMDQGCLDDLFRGATMYVVPKYDGDEVEVYARLIAMPKPCTEGWGLLQWRGRTLMRMSSGLYGVTMKDGRWAWSRSANEVVTWARQ